jgi:lysophospholipase L1-like esterase
MHCRRHLLLFSLACLLSIPALRADEAKPARVRVLLLGDSTAMGSVCRRVAPKADELEDVVRKLLAAEADLPPVEVVNQGRDGEFIQGLLSAHYDKDIARLPPVDFILVRYGINDRNKRQDFATNFPRDYRELIKRLHADFPHALVILETIIPYMGEPRDREVNDLVRQVAEAEKLPVLDTYARFAAELRQQGPNALTYRRVTLDKVPEKLRSLLPEGAVNGNEVVVMDNLLDAQFAVVPGWFGDRHPNLAAYHVIGDEEAKFLAPRIREPAKAAAKP